MNAGDVKFLEDQLLTARDRFTKLMEQAELTERRAKRDFSANLLERDRHVIEIFVNELVLTLRDSRKG